MRAVAILVLAAAGCHARVGGDELDGASGDAAHHVDAAAGIDAGSPDAAPCTGGNTHATDSGHCYEAFALPQAWGDAQLICQGRGGALVEIDSAAETAVVLAIVGPNRAFIGGTDAATEMQWVWSDGTPFTFTNWRTGEPNNGNGAFEEDCAVFEGANGGTWDDRPCDTDPLAPGVPGQYPYVCER